MNFIKRNALFYIFPQLRLIKFSFDSARFLYRLHKNKKKMKFALKLGIGCAVALLFFVIVGFVAFPHLIKSKIKKMVQLQPGLEIRDMFTNVPFGLTFNVYMFNVTNPMEVQEGKKPILKEVGPFCYSEWKKKVDIQDNDAEDVMFYKAADTFYKNPKPGCAPYDTLVTIPHPLIVGMVNTVMRQKPGAIGLISKAIKSIYQNPTSIYLTAKAGDILFDGVIINCGVKDFAGKAICTQLKETPELKHVNDDDLAFSLMGPKNGTPGKVFKVMRGASDFHKVGWILEYDEKKEMEIWPTKECNQLKGTDGTIFPPFLKKEEGLVSFAPDLCRSLAGVYSKNTNYDGIPVRLYTASLGDMSTDPDLKCYCPTPETCLKKGLMDLYLCAGMPIIVSLPHFYDSDKSLLNDVEGLNPNEPDHGIRIFFESMTGGPVSARKRLMFSFPLEPNPKVPVFEKLPRIYHPVFWVEEGVDLNRTFTQPIKTLFTMKKAVKITSWVIVVGSIIGIGASGYLFLKQSGSMDVTTSIPKVNPTEAIKKAAETMKTFKASHNVSQVNHADSVDNEVEKY